jgi:hypothetical protein
MIRNSDDWMQAVQKKADKTPVPNFSIVYPRYFPPSLQTVSSSRWLIEERLYTTRYPA